MKRIPFVTIAVIAAAVLTPGALEYDRAAILRGEVWRLVTAHLAHWSPDHLLWDVVAFAALGVVCERRHALFGAAIVATALSVSLILLVACPEVTAYRGLSAVASALWFWAVFIVAERRMTLAFVLAAMFFGKVFVELSTGASIFATDVAVLPSVHLIGAAVGFVAAVLERGGIHVHLRRHGSATRQSRAAAGLADQLGRRVPAREAAAADGVRRLRDERVQAV